MHLSRMAGRLAQVAGILLGGAAGLSLILLGGATASQTAAEQPTTRASTVEATHLPPLLTADGEHVELSYDVYCLPAVEHDVEADCDVAGTVYLRPGDSGVFQRLPVAEAPERIEGRYFAVVPDALVRSQSGFSYYAVLEDRTTGAAITLPAGGPDAPQRSISLGTPVEIDLGSHGFGRTRSATTRVAAAAWGVGFDEVGLEQGRNATPIGGASFDVARDGAIYVLDEAKRRALRWPQGESAPTAVPLAIDGTIADLAISDQDRLYVLETSEREGRPAVLRSFTTSGRPVDVAPLDEPAYRVRLGSAGAPHILQQTSGLWARAGGADGRLASPDLQRASGRPGLPLAGDRDVVVLRRGNEIRVGVIGPGVFRRTWRIRSDTPLAEVQLAEPLGSRLVVAVRAYADDEAEFIVLVLGGQGVVSRFSVTAWDWAETAPLSRFRLVGPSLYQLGSSHAGLFVDRFDLEVD